MFAGMVQLHPDGSALFHHRTAWSKLPACGPAGQIAGPITHVSPPSTPAQAGVLTSWRGWWGLLRGEVKTIKCGGGGCSGCSLRALPGVDEACGGRPKGDQASTPLPVTMIEVPNSSYIGVVSAAAAAAYKLLPFRE
jgi:hypothetical protein